MIVHKVRYFVTNKSGTTVLISPLCLLAGRLFYFIYERRIVMADLVEIRWHGRGGQGAKTAALLLADVAFKTGSFVQGFPEYGPERMGAPITAYNRISKNEIRVHSNIYEPDFVVVVDEGLLDVVNVTDGLKENGAIVINSSKSPSEIKSKLPNYNGKIYTIDARKVSIACLGKYFPNTPMLAAIVKVSKVMDKDTFLNEMENSFSHKFASKPEVIEGNMNALKMAFEEVK
jgi:pyruvate ferredoxin oxidoreductase gamma subunit